MLQSLVLVYAGRGSSHSWTWLSDLFESQGVHAVRFLDSDEFIASLAEAEVGVAIVSGGDGFLIADALKGKGFANMKRFIAAGGTFVGICAGAYLPLPSSIEPFSEFNISSTKIENISSSSSFQDQLDPRKAVPYGSCSIFHPVRGPVEIVEDARHVMVAPLYGGPIFKEPEEDLVMMRFGSFASGTEFQLDRKMAESTMLGRPAIIQVFYGKGRLVLFGPHLEHPRFSEANAKFLDLLGLRGSGKPSEPASLVLDGGQPELRRTISDLKVAILGLENRSFTVGHKAWDGSRLLDLVGSIKKRTWTLSDSRSSRIMSDLRSVGDRLSKMQAGSQNDADEAVLILVEAARICVDNHFQYLSRREAGTGPARCESPW